jgi:hypothetical protein
VGPKAKISASAEIFASADKKFDTLATMGGYPIIIFYERTA